MTHDTIAERITAATGASNITVQASDAYDIPEGSYLLEMSSPDGVIALRCKLTQAGFDVLHLVKLPGNKARGRIVPPVTADAPSPAFAVGDVVAVVRDLSYAELSPGGSYVVALHEGQTGTVHSTALSDWIMVRFEHEMHVSHWPVNPAWLRRVTTIDADDALNPEPREGGLVLDDEDMTWGIEDALKERAEAPDESDMPTVWASEHAAVVAERDALRDTVRKLAEARAAMEKEVVRIRQRFAEYPEMLESNRYRLNGKLIGLSDALALLPDTAKEPQS